MPDSTWTDALAVASGFPAASGACIVGDGSEPGDWHLPNINELVTLTDFDFSRPAISPDTPLSNIGSGKHLWSSTNYADSERLGQARVLESLDGHVRRADKSSAHGVLLVRDARDEELPVIHPATPWDVLPEQPEIVLRGVEVLEQIVSTSQTTCHDEAGLEIDCEGTGADGELQRGYSTSGPRFVDNGDGTVTDAWTSEIWLRDHGCVGFQNFHPGQESGSAMADPMCGLSDGSIAGDWALPSPKQFHQFSHWGEFSPAVDPDSPFVGVYTYRYWSSRLTASTLGLQAWAFNMGNGVITTDDPDLAGQQWMIVTVKRHDGPQSIECVIETRISPTEAIIACSGKGRSVRARLRL